MSKDKKQLTDDTQAIWDTFSRGGNFAHNMVTLKLQMMAEKHGKKAADGVYEELIEAGF